MKESLLNVIESNSSALVSNIDVSFLDDVIDFIESYNYNYLVLSSSSDYKHVRLGFINGANEYTGSEAFIKKRIFSELSIINSLLNMNFDEHYLTYIVEWIFYLHTVDTPLNYLDHDGYLFDYLIEFFEDRNYLNPSVEDQIAIKFLEVVGEFLADDVEYPIALFRDLLFSRPTIVIVSEANHLKALYIEQMLKGYYEDMSLIEEFSHPLFFVKVHS